MKGVRVNLAPFVLYQKRVIMHTLKAQWIQLNEANHVKESDYLAMWTYLNRQYSKPKRHYHNLSHLQAMFELVERSTTAIDDKTVLHYSIWFHDVIYNVLKHNNESKSAEKAKQYLTKIGFEKHRIDHCVFQIECTKAHSIPNDSSPSSDLELLLDVDLAILGRPWEAYEAYAQQIRAEFSIYPSLLYNPGRKKALTHFLERPFIYHTKAFFEAYEAQARRNIAMEIARL